MKIHNFILVGSGLSASSFALGYLEKNKTEKIVILSLKNTNNIRQETKYKGLLPHQMNQKIDEINKYKSNYRYIANKNVEIVGSLEREGLSNYWAGQIDNEINDFKFLPNKCFSELKDNLSLILKKLGKKQLNLINNQEINFRSSNMALINDKVVRPDQIIRGSKKRIIFLDFKLDSFIKKKEIFYLYCSNGSKKKIFYTKRLVLGCGTFATTILLIKYLNYKGKIKIYNHYRTAILLLAKKNLSQRKFPFAHLKKKVNKINSLLDFRTTNKEIFNYLKNNTLFDKLIFYIFKLLKNHIIISNLFISSKKNYFSLKKKNDNIFIEYPNFNKLKKISKNNIQIFVKDLIKEKIIFNIKLIKYLKPGNDYHYFGSFRMMGNDKKISVDYNCKLNSDKSITIIDGSVLYFKNNFFPTLLIMANALRIGKKYDI